MKGGLGIQYPRSSLRENFLTSTDWGCFLGLDTILLSIKGFPAEGDAITLAFFLAGCASATIHVLHVEEEGEQEEEALLEDLYAEISAYAKELKIKVNLETVEVHKSPAEVILSKARELKADLIVMGAQRLKERRELFGSQASEVARRAEVPVFVVFTPFEDWVAYRRVKIRRILVPYRDADVDTYAIKLAAAMASSAYSVVSPNIEIHLAYVIKIPDILPLDALNSPEFNKEKKEFLHDVGKFTSYIGEPVIPRILGGRNFGKAIIEYTRKINFDLLIITASHRPRHFRGMAGTDVYTIAKGAYCTSVVIFV